MKTVDKKKYIEREALIALFNERYDTAFVQERTRENKEHWRGVCAGLNWGRNTITDAPTADVVEVRHGYWFFTEHEYFSCSECGERYYNGCDSTYEAKEKLRNGEHHNYCPNCGAKMDGKGEDK